ncbi:uncharacterized protein PG998_007814 [Apiospora kogelbergensis]|uniref:uncharacterized protein n=1 Tax=Apiospora kogelbergensis TaxID=1337665 RepID=UPI00312D7BD6
MTRVTQLVGLLAFSSSLLSPLVAAQVDGSRIVDTTIDSRQVDGSRVGGEDIDARQVDGSKVYDTTVNWRRQVDGSHVGGDEIDSRQVDGSSVPETAIDSRQVDGSRVGSEGIDARQVDGSRITDDESLSARDDSEVKAEAAKKVPLRIMPLGASITQGVNSKDMNGYRKTVFDKLVTDGWKVDMVGCRANGTMGENSHHDGWPGFTIDQVHGKFTAAKGLKPNVVLLNAGTNDCAKPVDTAHAGKRLTSLIDDIFVSIPGVTVVISTLGPSGKHQACHEDLSKQYRDVFASYQKQKRRVALADLQKELDMKHIGKDGTHPTDDGYVVVGNIFHDAVKRVQGQIQKPAKQ